MQIQKSKFIAMWDWRRFETTQHLRQRHYKAGQARGDRKKGSMANPLDPVEKRPQPEAGRPVSGWLKVAGVAAVSAMAGGLAAAWWHRKTLAKLRQGEVASQNPEFRIPESDPADEA
jgi:hypothetical protein